MRHYRHSLLLTVPVLTWALAANAQVPVVDAGASGNGNSPPAQQSQSAQQNSNEVVLNLYLQLEQLQREVQDLRGMVEEQSYQIRRMETEQRDRYLDLDRRLSGISTSQGSATGNTGLAGGQTSPGIIPPVNGPGIPITPGNRPAGANASSTPGNQTPGAGREIPQNEQELYRTALSLLVEEEEYARSIALFQQYIEIYPMGRNIANAHYWRGAALVLVSRFNEAVQDFQKVISDYPQHQKAAGSLLKLGEAYNRMGDRNRARQTWQQISRDYPESLAEITIAEGYLQQFPAN
ncbi:MAG: tol-pal system protein YbgF [Pseudohongiellaceae bacterium]